jgi:hypothetical protein
MISVKCPQGVRDLSRGNTMRILPVLAAALSLIALAACGGSDDGSGPARRNQAGPYIGGAAGVGF